jgi:hypothetical protein
MFTLLILSVDLGQTIYLFFVSASKIKDSNICSGYCKGLRIKENYYAPNKATVYMGSSV